MDPMGRKYIVEIYSDKHLVVDGSDFTGTVCSLKTFATPFFISN